MPSELAGQRTGYVVKVYPRFSETFVVTEILAREAAGESLEIFALRPTTDARFHPQLGLVQAPVRHLPKPVRLPEAWAVIARAERELPDFGVRFAELLPWTSTLEPSEVVQGVSLALAAARSEITHLHVHFASMQARVARIAAHLLDIPYSVTTHAKDIFHADVDPVLLREVLLPAHHVVTISAFNARHLHRVLPELGERLVLVRNGLDLDRFPYRDPQPPGRRLEVCAVGRLVEKKGFDVLIEATRRARAAGLRLRVRIAGDGELTDDLHAQIAAAGLDDVVHLLGPRSQAEVGELLTGSDVMVAPCVVGADGNADGLPTVLLEAMAMGVPCISTAVTGIPEVVHDAVDGEPATGQLLTPGDADALTRALHRVAAPDYPRVDTARAARAQVERDFDTRRQSRLLAALQRTSFAAPPPPSVPTDLTPATTGSLA